MAKMPLYTDSCDADYAGNGDGAPDGFEYIAVQARALVGQCGGAFSVHQFARHFPVSTEPWACPLAGLRTNQPLRHSEHAHLLSDIEKLTLPTGILGSLFPFWSPTGDLVCQLEATST